MKRKWILAIAMGLLSLVVTASVVLATPGSGFSAVQQWKGVFDDINLQVVDMPAHLVKIKTKGVSDVYVTRNAIAPSGHSGWHTHPGPSLVIVTEGEVLVYDGDDSSCTPVRYTVGQGFVDEGGGHVHLVENASDTQAAETVAVQFLPEAATRRIDMPDPGNC